VGSARGGRRAELSEHVAGRVPKETR
jgi:hypothetical protein